MTNTNSSVPVAPQLHKAVFLDRDGVLNEEMGDYVWRPEDFTVLHGVPESLAQLKAAGYYLIVVTNQAGIAKGLYTASQMRLCHDKLQQACGNLIDAFYFAPSHPSVSESLARKPGSLMLEKAIARFHLDPSQCWLVGDRMRDLEAGARVGIKGILVGHSEETTHQPQVTNLAAATAIILAQESTR
ncbi:D-glycero-alpha-D-manno-heptose-1,7-bisphosphate 7-phosphatase [Hymenobacter crusticola]|uniref:D,D-heptose 1,7-bisphosphate phosphatase n=1 Tax=Hymenobacter crusticola TaxID=1770526 RepID=A0A243WG97_9BACT|nr:HAD family hydrolase [Hymenobacter crusticola]OUJ73971.1 D,D-heptose 1,7-bisphosphate phosphatase [Hymenobacter crusticola]